MLPYINLGFIKIPSYGLMVVIGIIAFCVVSIYVLKKIEKKSNRIVIQTLFLSAISLVVLYLSANFFDSLFHSIEEGKPVMGGITWEGGVIGGFAAFILLADFIVPDEKGNTLQLFSAVIPGIIIAHAFGRIGCFLGGCCFGAITEGPFGVVFPSGSLAAQKYPNTITGIGSFPVLPTQLFEAVFEFILFAVTIIFYKRLKGKNVSVYLVFYSIFRFILEFWRGDSRGATGLHLSPSQLMSVCLFISGILIYLYQKKIIFKKLYASRLLAYQTANAPVDICSENKLILEEIEKLRVLKNENVITEEEFQLKKSELLNKIK